MLLARASLRPQHNPSGLHLLCVCAGVCFGRVVRVLALASQQLPGLHAHQWSSSCQGPSLPWPSRTFSHTDWFEEKGAQTDFSQSACKSWRAVESCRSRRCVPRRRHIPAWSRLNQYRLVSSACCKRQSCLYEDLHTRNRLSSHPVLNGEIASHEGLRVRRETRGGKGRREVARHMKRAHVRSPRRAYAAGSEARSRCGVTTAARQGRGPRSWSAKAAERRLRLGARSAGNTAWPSTISG